MGCLGKVILVGLVYMMINLLGAAKGCNLTVLGTEHKTGSFFFRTLVKALTKNSCFGCKAKWIGHFQFPIEPSKQYVFSVRNPFAMVTSGYRYHKRGDEDVKISATPKTARAYFLTHGLENLRNKASEVGLPSFGAGETYAHYLQRVDERDGLLAQMLRNEPIWLPNTVYMAQQRGIKNVLVTCLEESERRGAEEVYREILSFLKVAAPCGNKVVLSAVGNANATRAEHGTDRSQDAAQQEIVKELDARYFGGKFANASEIIDCS